MGCRLTAKRLCTSHSLEPAALNKPAARPAISKSTETWAFGQPIFQPKIRRISPQKHPIHRKHAAPRSHPGFAPKSIHHLPLDAIFPTFYSLPIFDTRLAPSAIPVAVKGRSQCATSYCLLFPSKTPKSTAMHPTQLPLTEVSTLLD